MMGIMAIVESIFHGYPFIQCPDMPITPGLLERVLDTTGATKPTAIIAASILEELSSSQKGVEVLKRFHTVFIGGAPLPLEVGDRLSQQINLQNIMGSTETGLLVSLIQEKAEDWEYFEWAPAYGIEMRPAEGGGCELTIPRVENRDFHGIFHTFPDKRVYRTKDVYEQHPGRPHLWRFVGRLDDVIVLRNGEKFNPSAMENMIQSHPLVYRAMILGEGRFEAAALVEPHWDKYSGRPTEFVDQLWPYIEKANEAGPAYARLSKDKVAIVSKAKPLQTTAKGSIRRRAVLDDYRREIDAIYEQSGDKDLFEMPNDASWKEILKAIRQAASNLTGLPLEQIDRKASFPSQGLDSLHVLKLSRALRNMVRALNPNSEYALINTQMIYSCADLDILATCIQRLSNGEKSMDRLIIDNQHTRLEKIQALINKHSKEEYGPRQPIRHFNRIRTHVVILTGSTGSLGCYLLYQLLENPLVSRVYCLNRSQDSEERQRHSFRERGLQAQFENRVEFLHANLASENFGLPRLKYDALLRSVDTIIHNAWKINFHHPVEAFEHPHIEGIARLIGFSRQSMRKAHVHFVSSVAAVGAWSSDSGASIPETVINDLGVSLPQGYGESKLIAEQILAAASSRMEIPSTIYRVGQIAGPSSKEGQWNTQEWVPSLIKTSKALQMVPQDLGGMVVDWITVV